MLLLPISLGPHTAFLCLGLLLELWKVELCMNQARSARELTLAWSSLQPMTLGNWWYKYPSSLNIVRELWSLASSRTPYPLMYLLCLTSLLSYQCSLYLPTKLLALKILLGSAFKGHKLVYQPLRCLHIRRRTCLAKWIFSIPVGKEELWFMRLPYIQGLH